MRHATPLGNQPSEQTLWLLVELQERTSAGPAVSRITNYAEGRGIKAEPPKTRGTPFLMQNGPISLTAIKPVFSSPPPIHFTTRYEC